METMEALKCSIFHLICNKCKVDTSEHLFLHFENKIQQCYVSGTLSEITIKIKVFENKTLKIR